MRRGVADFTLDTGKVPPWLFQRMVRLARSILWSIRAEFGTKEVLQRLADPVWFQSFGTVLAFDWNASGLTTTTMGAVKQAIKGSEYQLGFFVCGGKGRVSRKVPSEIKGISYRVGINHGHDLEITSRLTAKIDSSLIRDGFVLYHHNFLFDIKGNWAVIQQGMNTTIGRARRYHWFGNWQDVVKLKQQFYLASKTIISHVKLVGVVDLSAPKSDKNRHLSLELIQQPKDLFKDLRIISSYWQKKRQTDQLMLFEDNKDNKVLFLAGNHKDFGVNWLKESFDFNNVKRRLEKVIVNRQPQSFFDLLIQPGVGGKTLRAISLVAELIYGAKPAYTDPVRYSFAHGGKDGVPYPVDTFTYDKTLEIIEKAIKKAKGLCWQEKEAALKRLYLKSKKTR